MLLVYTIFTRKNPRVSHHSLKAGTITQLANWCLRYLRQVVCDRPQVIRLILFN